MSDQRLLILSGTASQAANYMREQNLMPSQIAYVMGADQLRGIQNPTYVIVGTFWDRPDCIRIWETLKRCMTDGREMKAPAHIETFLETKPTPAPPPPPPPPPPPVKLVELEPIPEPTLAKAIKFKHIKAPKPPNGGFKHIKP